MAAYAKRLFGDFEVFLKLSLLPVKIKLFFAAFFFLSLHSFAQTIESEINLLAGEFSGNYTSYIVNAEGEVIESINAQETLSTGDPVINDSIAYVIVNCVRDLGEPNIPPQYIELKQGFHIKDGEITGYFSIWPGGESKQEKVSDNTYVYAQPISSFMLRGLGFTNAISGTSITIKVIVMVNGVETQKITKHSTVVLEENGTERIFQFISLVAYRQRVK